MRRSSGVLSRAITPRIKTRFQNSACVSLRARVPGVLYTPDVTRYKHIHRSRMRVKRRYEGREAFESLPEGIWFTQEVCVGTWVASVMSEARRTIYMTSSRPYYITLVLGDCLSLPRILCTK